MSPENQPPSQNKAEELIQTKTQVSAGGVAVRREGKTLLTALISVGEHCRWQLPKGLVMDGETHEQAALREVREEAGIHTRSACAAGSGGILVLCGP